jgi:hypothetical protein
MGSEENLIDAFESIVHKDFPNPNRDGCPGHNSLMKLALEASAPDCAGILAHVRRCAPCFDKLKELRRKAK